MNSILAGALIAGLIIGAIPAIAGSTRGKLGLGLGGFAACVVASLLLGMLLSIPTCAVFMYFIYKKPAPQSAYQENPTLSHSSALALFCTACGGRLENGPNFCPHCGAKIG